MIEKMTLQQWSEVISVHRPAHSCGQAVGRVMLAQGKAGRGPGVHREYLVGRRKSRFYRPDKLCRGKERPVGHDDVGRQGMVEIRRSNELGLLRRCRRRP